MLFVLSSILPAKINKNPETDKHFGIYIAIKMKGFTNHDHFSILDIEALARATLNSHRSYLIILGH